jgi:hypothetical protein
MTHKRFLCNSASGYEFFQGDEAVSRKLMQNIRIRLFSLETGAVCGTDSGAGKLGTMSGPTAYGGIPTARDNAQITY